MFASRRAADLGGAARAAASAAEPLRFRAARGSMARTGHVSGTGPYLSPRRQNGLRVR